jgi:hypothetical protein
MKTEVVFETAVSAVGKIINQGGLSTSSLMKPSQAGTSMTVNAVCLRVLSTGPWKTRS